MEEIVVVIVGTKDFDNYDFLEEKIYEKLENFINEKIPIIIRTQKENNVDIFASKFAKENNFELEQYKIDWENLGKKAGFENIKKLIWGEETKKGADYLFIFQNKWDEQSKYITSKILKEFKSIINIFEFNLKKYYIYSI